MKIGDRIVVTFKNLIKDESIIKIGDVGTVIFFNGDRDPCVEFDRYIYMGTMGIMSTL